MLSQANAAHKHADCPGCPARIKAAKGFPSMQAQEKGMSPELVLQFLAWNAEATGRCETLSPAGAAPGNVRSLFHSSTVQRACPGCLLEQVRAAIQCQLRACMQELQYCDGPTYSHALCICTAHASGCFAWKSFYNVFRGYLTRWF